MSTIGTEQKMLSDVVKHEYAGLAGFTRKKVSFKNTAGLTLGFGTVLGKRLVNGAAVAAAVSGNTGNGAMGSITVSSTAKLGNYVLTITSASSNAGGFRLEYPDGGTAHTGNVASAFSGGGLAFTLADGATDFVVGDRIVITVTGDWEYDVATVTAVDGTAKPAGIFIGTPDGKTGYGLVVAAATATDIVALVKGPASVGKDELVLDASWNTTAEKNMLYDALENLNILVHDQA